MKSFVVFILAALCATALADRQSEWAESAKQCAQKQNINLEDIKKVMTGEIKSSDVTQNMKCYFLCMSEKEGVSKDGVFQPQVLAERLSNAPNKDDIAKAIAACKDTKGTDNCDTSFKIMACMAQFKKAMK